MTGGPYGWVKGPAGWDVAFVVGGGGGGEGDGGGDGDGGGGGGGAVAMPDFPAPPPHSCCV